MRKLLLNPRVNHSPLFKKLRQLLVLTTLLFTLPQTAWGTYYNSGTYDDTNKTWGAWTLSDGPTYSKSSSNPQEAGYYYLEFSDASTITLTLAKPANTTDVIQGISIEIGDGVTTTTLQSAMIGTTDITSFFKLNTGVYTYTPTDPAEWSGNIVITLQGANNQGGLMSASVTTAPKNYNLWIGGLRVTSANKESITGDSIVGGTVTFDPNNNILTLNGVTIYNCITSGLPNLTIKLKGTSNKVNTYAGSNGSENNVAITSNINTATLTIEREENATTELVLKAANNNSIITNFASVSYGTGNKQTYLLSTLPAEYDNTNKYFHRYWPSESAQLDQATITSNVTYPIWVSGIQITHADLGDESTDHYTYDESDNALILNGINIGPADGYCICSAVASLSVKLVGTNSINITRPFYNFYNGDATISFTTNITNPGTLSLTCSAASAPNDVIIGFSNGNNPTVNNGLLWQPTISSGKTISATISSVSIMVAGNVPAANGSITGSGITAGTVTFTPATASTPNILTLDGATITGQIISNVGDLTIHITGSNTINAENTTDTYVISSTNNGKLTFETDANANTSVDNSLILRKDKNDYTSYFANIPINGFSSIEYGIGLGYNASFSQIEEILTVESGNSSFKLNSSNANDIVGNGGKVKYSYDSTNGHVLTLDGASIDYVFWNNDADLTIALNGTCRIIANGTNHTNSINSGGKLNIVKVSSDPAELIMSVNSGSPINATGLTLESGLYLKPIDTDEVVITEDPEFVLHNGYAMTNGQTIQQGGGSLVYTESGSEKTLTFTNFQEAFGDGNGQVNAIETGVVGLKVILIGNNKITCNDNGALAFKSIQTNASIQFVKGGDGCKLTMDTKTANPLSFGSGKVTYDRLIYYSSGANEKYICEPTAPTMVYNDQEEKVTLGKTYTDGDIYYTITYADGKTANVAKTKYTAEFALDAPGTVEAWVEANGATTSTVKGKHFGYKDAPFVMAVNETKTPVLIPAIETGDNIGYAASDAYTSSDAGVATFAGRVITAKAFGNATLTTTMAYSGQTANVVILNSDKKFETVVKVAKEFNYVNFASGQSYATCILPEKLTKPDGLKVYYITGTNGNTVTTQEIDYLPDGIPILLEKTAETIGSVTARTDSSSVVSGNILQYATSDVNTTGSQYILYKNEFVKASGTILPGKCYLQISTNLPARGVLGIGNDGSTAIEGIEFEATKDEEWYDLQGRRIQKPTKPGLYIVNGKKVVVTNK